MYKIAAIIGGVLLLAGVALAGTVTSLGSASNPNPTLAPLSATIRQEDRGLEREVRGQEREVRGRAKEAGEDIHRQDRAARHSGRDSAGDDGGQRGHGGHGNDD